jgi:hypothetical protein
MQPVAESVGAYNTETGTYNLKGQVPASISFKKEAKSVMELTPDGPIQKLSKDGVPVFRDVELVTVRQPGGVDSIIYELDKWLNSVIPSELNSGRLHPDIAEYYRKAAKRYRLKAPPLKPGRYSHHHRLRPCSVSMCERLRNWRTWLMTVCGGLVWAGWT